MADKINDVLVNAPPMLVIDITTPDGKSVYDSYLMPKVFSSGKVGYYDGDKGGKKLLITRVQAEGDDGDPVYVEFQLNHQWVAIKSDVPVEDLR